MVSKSQAWFVLVLPLNNTLIYKSIEGKHIGKIIVSP